MNVTQRIPEIEMTKFKAVLKSIDLLRMQGISDRDVLQVLMEWGSLETYFSYVLKESKWEYEDV